MFNIDELALKAFSPDPTNQTQRDVQDALLRYFTLKKTYDTEELLTDSIFGNHAPPPLQDSQELNDAENDRHRGRGVLAALGLNMEPRLKSSTRTPEVTKDFSELERALARRGGPPRAGGLTPILKEATAYGGRIKRGGSSAAALRRAIGSL